MSSTLCLYQPAYDKSGEYPKVDQSCVPDMNFINQILKKDIKVDNFTIQIAQEIEEDWGKVLNQVLIQKIDAMRFQITSKANPSFNKLVSHFNCLK